MHDRYIQTHTRTSYSSVQQYHNVNMSGSGTLCLKPLTRGAQHKNMQKTQYTKTEKWKHSGNRTYDLITFSRSASYLPTTRCCLHTLRLTKRKNLLPRLHRLQCTSIMIVQIFLQRNKKKNSLEKKDPRLESRTTCSMGQQPNRLCSCSYM